MIVRCKNCNTAFSVDDEKVNNKKFAFSCPKCSAENMIDNRKAESEVDSQADMQQAPLQDEFTGSEVSTDSMPGEGPVDFGAELDSPGTESGDIGGDFDLDSEMKGIKTGTESEGIPVSEQKPIEDELGGDIDGLDLDIDLDEDTAADEMAIEDEIPVGTGAAADGSDIPLDDLDIDINNLEDLDALQDEKTRADTGDLDSMEYDSAVKTAVSDDLSEDLPDGLDIDTSEIDESVLSEMSDIDLEPDEEQETMEMESDEELVPVPDSTITEDVESVEDDDSITIDLDSLDIDLEEGEEGAVLEGESPELYGDEESGEVQAATGDLSDTTSEKFDIDLSDEELADIESDLSDLDSAEPPAGEVATTVPDDTTAEESEDITLDLDSLDIDLDEDETILEGEKPEEIDIDITGDEALQETSDIETASLPEDESITLDLDSLDIDLDETADVKKGEILEEDEKITLTDAGLTLDDLTQEEIAASMEDGDEEEEELKLSVGDIDPDLNIEDLHADQDEVYLEEEDDLKLTVEEIDPNLDIDNLEDEFREVESVVDESGEAGEFFDDMVDLTEIEDEEEIRVPAGAKRQKRAEDTFDEELMEIDLDDTEMFGDEEISGHRHPDITRNGAVNFSIDFAIKYSRIGAVLRLLGLFTIGLLPHFIVFFIYSLLSSILGYINQIVVLFSGEIVEDFAEIQENTLRYLLYIGTSQMGIVEDMPVYTGKADIDHPLQMNVTYPLHYSRWIAFLRLTGIGIILFNIPHLIILGLLSLVIPFIFLVGLVIVLITGGWPHLLYDILTQYYRYAAQVLAFAAGLIDDYPPFKFD